MISRNAGLTASSAASVRWKELSGIVEHLGVRRALVLTGRTLATKTDLVARVERALGAAHAGTFAECGQHVPAGTVDACVAQAKDAQADVLVVFGGGSPIDTAKMVVMRLVEAGHAAPHQIVIPTTLSAGEFTYAAGITDETTRVKHVHVDPATQPGVILYDPELTQATPTELWLTTGLKALDHAIEGLWWPVCHPFLETLRLGAIADLTAHLARSSDPECAGVTGSACQHAAWKSIWGLLSAKNVGFRLSHPLGHQIGARWDVPHGVTSCIALPGAARFLHQRTRYAQAKIARAMGMPDGDAAAPAIEAFSRHARCSATALPDQRRGIGDPAGRRGRGARTQLSRRTRRRYRHQGCPDQAARRHVVGELLYPARRPAWQKAIVDMSARYGFRLVVTGGGRARRVTCGDPDVLHGSTSRAARRLNSGRSGAAGVILNTRPSLTKGVLYPELRRHGRPRVIARDRVRVNCLCALWRPEIKAIQNYLLFRHFVYHIGRTGGQGLNQNAEGA